MHPAFLTEVVPEEASDKQIIQTPSPKKHHQKHSSPRKEEVIQPPPKQPAKTADDLLDEMLGLGDSNTITTKVPPAESPTLLDLDLGGNVSSPTKEESPRFNFDPEPAKNSKKDAILAQLRDLHASSEPETILGSQLTIPKPDSPKVSNEKKSIFNIFDEAPVEPKIQPKELKIPRSVASIQSNSIKSINDFDDDDVDQILTLKPSNTGKSRSSTLDYNFSEPIQHLHEGKSSNGTDYRAPKKENLIDNLFGNTDFDDIEEVY